MPQPIESYVGGFEENATIRDLMAKWRLDQATGGNDSTVSNCLRQFIEQSPNSALTLIVALCRQYPDEKAKVALSEELEWMLQVHGVEYWDTINALCSRVPEFRAVMSCVWGAGLSKELKRKVEMWRS